MSFDLAIGVHRSELDAISAGLYQSVYPHLFTETETVDYGGIEFTVAWDVKAPAVFDLSDTGAARQAIADRLASLPGNPHPPELLAAAAAAAFSFTYPTVKIVLTGGKLSSELDLKLTAAAKMVVNGDGSQSIDVFELTTPPLPDKTENVLVQQFILPKILSAIQVIFGGLRIPPLEVAGLQLSTPVPFVQEERLVAIANVATATSPTPPGPGEFPWPQGPFFALLSEKALQVATANALASGGNRFGPHGGGGFSGFGYEWHAEATVSDAEVHLDGTQLVLIAGITGSAGATVEALWLEAGVDYTLYPEPSPAVTLQLEVEGNSLVVRTASVEGFVLVAAPSGGVATWIISAVLDAIAQAIVLALSPLIREYLQGIVFASLAIPSYQIAIGSITVTATPSDLQIANAGGMLCLEGQLAISA